MYCITTNGSNSHKVYLDTQLILESTGSISRTNTPSSQPWNVGRDDGMSRYGNGYIYNVARYNRALSASEILQNYNALKGRFGV
jgi:hypothetical protein